METLGKLAVLAEGAKYDVSCSSSGSAGRRGAVGSTSLGGICHSWSDDGRCISLLKVLFSNDCVFDCAYCVNRRSADVPRGHLHSPGTRGPDHPDVPEKLYRRALSQLRRRRFAGRHHDATRPDGYVLREEHRFGGYIHAKAIGASASLLGALRALADRMSVNIRRLPSETASGPSPPRKSRNSISAPWPSSAEPSRSEKKEAFRPVRTGLRSPRDRAPSSWWGPPRGERLYHSAPVRRTLPETSGSSGSITPPTYPWRITPPSGPRHGSLPCSGNTASTRRTGSSGSTASGPKKSLTPEQPDLDVALDPKTGWALGHPDFFPVDVNRASYEEMLRVPGIGVKVRTKDSHRQEEHLLDGDDLGKLGVVMKRARFFVACKSPAFPAFPAGGDLGRLLSSPPRGRRIPASSAWNSDHGCLDL